MQTRSPVATAEQRALAMCAAGAELGFSPSTPSLAPKARAVAMRLMGNDVASVKTIVSILALQRASILVFIEAGSVTGIVATLLLRASAEPTLEAGGFDGLAPDEAFLARPEEPSPIYYLWGIAGATKTASTAVMELSRRLRYGALAELTAYARAATPVGRHVGVTQLGFRPVRRPDDDLLISAPLAARLAA